MRMHCLLMFHAPKYSAMIKAALSCTALCLLTACSTVPDPYVPSEIGEIRSSNPTHGLQLTIEPVSDELPFREPVHFRVILENVGEQAYWVPREPFILFYWIYPTSVRDHYVRERPAPQHYTKSEVKRLEPGQRLVYSERIETYYFPRPGIVEFWAHYVSAQNLNTAITPHWTGRLVSNSYGVRFN